MFCFALSTTKALFVDLSAAGVLVTFKIIIEQVNKTLMIKYIHACLCVHIRIYRCHASAVYQSHVKEKKRLTREFASRSKNTKITSHHNGQEKKNVKTFAARLSLKMPCTSVRDVP